MVQYGYHTFSWREHLVKNLLKIGLTFILITLMTACSIIPSDKVKIVTTKLNENESNLLKLMGCDNSRIYDFELDKTGKSVQIKSYTLDENNQWKQGMSQFGNMSGKSGKVSIWFVGQNKDLRIGFQDNEGVESVISNAEEESSTKYLSGAISWAETADIEYEKEIPLAIQIETNKNAIRTFGVDSFHDIESLKEFEKVTAVTITFSTNEVE